MAGRHYFTQSQWCFPTKEHYKQMRIGLSQANHGGDYLRREYDDLRREYDDLRREYDDLRRPFSVTADVPYTDVWDFATVGAYRGKHPCEKPLDLMTHIVRTSSKPGAVVLDAFMGSGSTGEATLRLGQGRSFIGIDRDPRWVEFSRRRLARLGDVTVQQDAAQDANGYLDGAGNARQAANDYAALPLFEFSGV
jgi:site-specific DNA-methyltransferase (adenine-specific)